ncbi:MAG: ABC transporter ATP-binding protein [Clostridia bacterium]|nr:ABC transporter ATP-binding protein [Clostridia bacterium]
MHRKSLVKQLFRKNAIWFLGAFVCTVACVVLDYIIPLVLAETLDHYLSGKPSVLPEFMTGLIGVYADQDYVVHHLYLVGLAIVGLNLLNGVFSYGKGRFQAQAGENVSRDLRNMLYDHIQRLPFSYHMRAETGDLVQRCTSDVDTVRRFLAMQLMSVINAVFMIVTALVVLFGRNVRLTLLSMIVVPALFVFAFLFFKWVIKAFRASDEAEGRMSAVLQENLTGVRVVRAFGRQAFEIDKFNDKVTDLANKNFRVNLLLAIYWATGDFLSMTQSMITLLVCLSAVISGEITLGVMVIYTTYVGKLLFPIRQLGRILSDAGKSMVALDRIGQILDEPTEPEEKDALKPELNGNIEFSHVTFGYGDEPVLRDLNMTIRSGETIAILGATGSGKSTIAYLLQRLFPLTEGDIRIGGVSINDIDRAWLRQHIGLVLQEPFLYSRTIRENVSIARPSITEADVDHAVRDAGALSFILESEKGFDTVVGERGVTLSGGQKQRLAIARTLLKDNSILIFDDSLSAVDTQTDAEIRAALKNRRKDVTTIIISHRVNTLKDADRIIVLENGCVAQQGTHDELIHEDGLYRRVYQIQTSLENELLSEV